MTLAQQVRALSQRDLEEDQFAQELDRMLIANFDQLFDAFSRRAFAISESKGFFAAEETFGDHVALAHSELSEALQAYRSHGFSDFYTIQADDSAKPEGVRAELADAIIRTASLAAARGLWLGPKLLEKLFYNATRPHKHGGKRL